MKKKSLITLLTCCILFSSMFICMANENWSLWDDPSVVENSEVKPIFLTILGTLQWVGYLVSIAMLIWAGIRYMTSSVGEKVKAKESLVPMVVGAILVAGATWIASAVFNL